MKHSIKELYHINGQYGLYTKEAVDKAGLHIKTRHDDWWVPNMAIQAIMRVSSRKPFKIYHSVGNKTDYVWAYGYGEQAWFDTEEERSTFLTQLNEEAIKNRVVNATKALEKAQTEYKKALETYNEYFNKN